MGWLDRLLGGNTASSRPAASSSQGLRVAVDARGNDYMAVVGESFYADAFARVTGGAPGEYAAELLLVREPGNAYDSNAIAVQTSGGIKLGHLSRENARRFAAGLDDVGGRARVNGEIRREPQHANWNVVLRVDYGRMESW